MSDSRNAVIPMPAVTRVPPFIFLKPADAIGLDMTRRDLQGEMKKQGRPWCIGIEGLGRLRVAVR